MGVVSVVARSFMAGHAADGGSHLERVSAPEFILVQKNRTADCRGFKGLSEPQITLITQITQIIVEEKNGETLV